MKTLVAIMAALLPAGPFAFADLVFENTLLEFQVGADDTKVTADFAFRNDGDQTVHIVKSETGCACLNIGVSGGKFDYNPGETGVVRAVFDLRNYTGSIDRHLVVWHGPNRNSPVSTQLTVRAHIPVLVSIAPLNVTWGVKSPAEPRIFDIAVDPAKDVRILDAAGTSENFNLEIKTLEEGRRYQLVVTPRSTDTPGIGVIRIQTDSDNERFKVLQAFAIVRQIPPAP